MRLKASVTIFLSLVITVVIVVVCTVIESARISVSQMEGKAATYMAVESVFAGYGKHAVSADAARTGNRLYSSGRRDDHH